MMRNVFLALVVLWLCSCARYHAETDWRIAKTTLLKRCADGLSCPATITISFKEGEVSEFQMMPPIPFLATISTVVGD